MYCESSKIKDAWYEAKTATDALWATMRKRWAVDWTEHSPSAATVTSSGAGSNNRQCPTLIPYTTSPGHHLPWPTPLIPLHLVQRQN